MQSEPLGKGLVVISRSCVRVSCYLKLLQFMSNSELFSIFAPDGEYRHSINRMVVIDIVQFME